LVGQKTKPSSTVQYHPKGVKENIQCTKQKKRKKKNPQRRKREGKREKKSGLSNKSWLNKECACITHASVHTLTRHYVISWRERDKRSNSSFVQ